MTSPITLLLADARLPAGGHTQSGGLEPAIADGLTDVSGYCRTRLATVVRTEAATAVVARFSVLQGRPVAAVEAAWAARTPSDAMRRTARFLGSGLLLLVRRVWPEVARLWPEGAEPPRAVLLGAVAALTGVSAEDLASVVAYDDVQTVLSAASKLLPLDPMQVTSWCVELVPELDQLVKQVAVATTTDHIPATGSPLIEGWAQTHARTTRRLFNG